MVIWVVAPLVGSLNGEIISDETCGVFGCKYGQFHA